MRGCRYPFSLTDHQLQTVMLTAASIAVDRPHSFLLAISTKLKLSRSDHAFPTDLLLQKVLDAAVQEMAA
jgi:hypothetical protein